MVLPVAGRAALVARGNGRDTHHRQQENSRSTDGHEPSDSVRPHGYLLLGPSPGWPHPSAGFGTAPVPQVTKEGQETPPGVTARDSWVTVPPPASGAPSRPSRSIGACYRARVRLGQLSRPHGVSPARDRSFRARAPLSGSRAGCRRRAGHEHLEPRPGSDGGPDRRRVRRRPGRLLILDGRNSLRDVAYPEHVRVLGVGIPPRAENRPAPAG